MRVYLRKKKCGIENWKVLSRLFLRDLIESAIGGYCS